MGLKRKKSSTKTANWDYPTPNLTRKSNTKEQEQRTTKRKEKQQAKKKYYYTEMFSKICTLTEEDMIESDWGEVKEASKIEYFEEMCIKFEQPILNVLLHQVVNEFLTNFPSKKP